jgi:hypothetical protein
MTFLPDVQARDSCQNHATRCKPGAGNLSTTPPWSSFCEGGTWRYGARIRSTIESRDEKSVAVRRAATDDGVNRSDPVYEWLRR